MIASAVAHLIRMKFLRWKLQLRRHFTSQLKRCAARYIRLADKLIRQAEKMEGNP